MDLDDTKGAFLYGAFIILSLVVAYWLTRDAPDAAQAAQQSQYQYQYQQQMDMINEATRPRFDAQQVQQAMAAGR
jgi:hypothetical protein